MFAEDLETCRRWVLMSSRGGGDGGSGSGSRGRSHASCLAVSANGAFVARGSSSRQPAVDGSGSGCGSGGPSCLTVWHLSPDGMRKPRVLAFGGGGGDTAGRSRAATAALPRSDTLEEGVEDDEEVVAVAFSPSGSDLCTVGRWDGTRCLLKLRPTSALVDINNSKAITASSAAAGAPARAVVASLSSKTSAVCVLPPTKRAAAAVGKPEPYLFVTGGEDGLRLWRRVYDDNGTTAHGRRSSGGGDNGGVTLLGTASAGGGRATALASVGRFVVVAADVGGVAAGPSTGGLQAVPSVTAVDVNWLAAGGHVGEGFCGWTLREGMGRHKGWRFW